MAIEEIKANNGNGVDEFPKGLKVLAVDDDPISLKILDALLRKCHYHVTTTSQAREALNMLRENRNRFDLIISDVHMPDMDGFKLLELVGLEMDLPVIMLSVRSDLDLVMKGINHGACDYLVKPVRIEELRNIWQHVFRRKVHFSKSLALDGNHNRSEGAQGPALTCNTDQNEKINGKRKEQDDEESDHDDDDPSARKKTRFVWTLERHRKFVAAVNRLGIDKAVPKRILDMMNEEGLTRENVASHLQKYRLFLRKKGSAELQQGQDASYMGTFNEVGEFGALAGSGMLSSNTGLSSYAHSGGMLGRLTNRPVNENLGGFTSSAVIQPSHSQNLSNSTNALGKFCSLVPPVQRNPNMSHGIPSCFNLDQFNHPNMLSGISPQMQNGVGFINQSPTGMASLYSDSFNFGSSSSSDTFEDGRFHKSWQNNFQSLNFPPNTLTLTEPHNNVQFPSTSLMHNSSSPIQNSPNLFSSNPAVSASFEGPGECHGNFFGTIAPNVNPEPDGPQQDLQNCTYNSDNAFSNLNPVAPFSQCMGQNNGRYSQSMEGSVAADLSNGGFGSDAYSSL